MRACAQNCVSISVALLSDPGNERLLTIVERCGRPVLNWDIAQRASVKDSSSAEAFMVSHSFSDYMAYVCQIVSATRDVPALVVMQLVKTMSESSRLAHERGEVIAADDYADVLGQLMWNIALERRGLWLNLGWPWSMCRVS